MENGRVVGIGGKRIREAERGGYGGGAKQIEGVEDLGENDGVSVQIERGGGLRQFPWRPSQEERAWAWDWAWTWAGRQESVVAGWGSEESVVIVKVRRIPRECGC